MMYTKYGTVVLGCVVGVVSGGGAVGMEQSPETLSLRGRKKGSLQLLRRKVLLRRTCQESGKRCSIYRVMCLPQILVRFCSHGPYPKVQAEGASVELC